MTSSGTARWPVVAVTMGLALTAGCTVARPPIDPDTFGAGELRLVSYDSCEEAVTELRAAAAAQLTAWADYGWNAWWGNAADGTEGGGPVPPDALGPVSAPAPAPMAEQAADLPMLAQDAAARAGGGAATDHSGTNVHEAGVDEPDLIKTDGRRIVVISNGWLRVIDAERGVQTGTLSLTEPTPDGIPGGWRPADLLLHGDRALVLFGPTWWAMPMPMPLPAPVEPGLDDVAGLPAPVVPEKEAEPVPGGVESVPGGVVEPVPGGVVEPVPDGIMGPRLLLVDISGAPRVISEYTVDGDLVDARAVGPVVRVVVRSAPRIPVPELDVTSPARRQLHAQRAALAAAEITDWLPRYRVADRRGVTEGQVECTSMSRPASFSGTSMLTLLTFDLTADGLGDGLPVSVVADGETVYSNGTSLYVASDQRWKIANAAPRRMPDPAQERTEIYKFDLSQPGQPRFAAAGSVPGWLVNQYALSEWEGRLRVATTTGGFSGETESAVYVLDQRGERLETVGSVGGLGRTERIYAVRFVGPIGYVVTFRETDPLYTVDLSDPTRPTVLGELKITGYSSYLHPIGPDRLIGVGQAADEQGFIQGIQVSLFDVSDLSDPLLLATHHVAGGHSAVEFDPHAFLWWPEERLLVIPVEAGMAEKRFRPVSEALLLRVEADQLVEVGAVSHPTAPGREWLTSIQRSLVVDETLWTLSELGLQANALSNLQRTAWIQF